MAGTYELRKNGKARLQYMLNGQRYSSTVEAKTDRQAERKLAEFIVQIEKGEFVNTDYTFAEFAQVWYDKHVKTQCSPATQQSYKKYLNSRIIPILGNYKLININKVKLQDFFNEMKTWKTYKGTPIARKTYTKIYKLVSTILQNAYEWELLNSNPCRTVPLKSLHLERLPSELEKLKNKQDKKTRAYNLDTYNKVLEILKLNLDYADKDTIKKIATITALQTGFGIEELAGLKWDRDYNYKNATLTITTVKIYINKTGWIEKEPKAESRSRTIKITSELNNLLFDLQQHYNTEYIFSDLMNFTSYTSWLKRWQTKNNINPILTAHELRHTHATILLLLGVDIKTISKRLGHSDTQITMETYVEYLPENDNNVIKLLEKITPKLPQTESQVC